MLDLAFANAQEAPNPTSWRLNLFNDFLLVRGESEKVELPTRKVEGLLAILAVNRDLGVARDEIAEMLWPERPLENQRSNLRQALAQLRRAIGEGSLDTSRSHVRLSSQIRLLCDYDDPEVRSTGAFMPGQEGPWFEEMRLETVDSSDVEQADGFPTLVDSFRENLRWFSSVDPKGMFGLLRSNPALSRGLQYPDLRRLIDGSPMFDEVTGWISYWRGIVEEDLEKSIFLLQSALQSAKNATDLELASETCLELGRAYCRTGNLSSAEKICTLSEGIADRMKTKASRAQALRLRGTVIIHWGDPLSGLKMMEAAEELTDDPVARTHILAIRANYFASIGDFEKAAKNLDIPLKTWQRLGHSGIELNVLMSKLLIQAGNSDPRHFAKDFEWLSSRAHSLGSQQFVVYADELMAKVLHLDHDRGSANQRLQKAKCGRLQTQMVMTEIEASRIKSLEKAS